MMHGEINSIQVVFGSWFRNSRITVVRLRTFCNQVNSLNNSPTNFTPMYKLVYIPIFYRLYKFQKDRLKNKRVDFQSSNSPNFVPVIRSIVPVSETSPRRTADDSAPRNREKMNTRVQSSNSPNFVPVIRSIVPVSETSPRRTADDSAPWRREKMNTRVQSSNSLNFVPVSETSPRRTADDSAPRRLRNRAADKKHLNQQV
jgi:hypothetical protein